MLCPIVILSLFRSDHVYFVELIIPNKEHVKTKMLFTIPILTCSSTMTVSIELLSLSPNLFAHNIGYRDGSFVYLQSMFKQNKKIFHCF